MNKYQEELNNLVKSSCPNKKACQECDFETMCNSEAKGWIDTLQELVERATPKKLKETNSTLRCPNCNRHITNKGSIHSTINNCPKCGQALDWSNEDEN